MAEIKIPILKGVSENQKAMEGYMRNQFHFLGVKSPERKSQTIAFLEQVSL